jgi:ubiquinone/menaquinone biosynthesis C-methylase UbiE
MILARLLRFAFHLLYHQLAFAYDAIAWMVSAGLWKDWVLSMAPRLSGSERILEIGHGPGHLQLALIRNGHRVAGVDLSPQMAHIARRRLIREGHAPVLARADARKLPFPGGHFDAVVATFPAEYIAERDTWDSFRRVLAPGGRVLVLLGANPLGRTPLHLLSRLLFRVTGQQTQGAEELIRQRLEASIGGMGIELDVKSADVRRSTVFYLEGRVGE